MQSGKFIELKIRDSQSLTMLTDALTRQGYLLQTSVVWKEYPSRGIDYFALRVEEPENIDKLRF